MGIVVVETRVARVIVVGRRGSLIAFNFERTIRHGW